MRHANVRTRLALGAALFAASVVGASGCLREHRNPYKPPRTLEQEPEPQSDPDFPDRVEKVQIGPGGPIGYIRIKTKWMTEEKKKRCTVVWVYDESFSARGLWMESGDTVRFGRGGRRENLGLLVQAQAFYTLLTGSDKFPADQTTEPDVIYLKMDKPRTGFEKPGDGEAAAGGEGAPVGDGGGGEAGVVDAAVGAV